MSINLTSELLAAAMGCTASVAHVWANALDDACDTYTIDTPERMAPFFAQLGEESSALSVLVESLNYTPERLLVVFGEHRISAENAQRYGRTADHAADQEAIANIVYGGEWGREHLGNTHPGDGWKFRGRGPIQTSGRYNAARVTMRLREKFNGVVPDFEEQPELLEIPRWGALAAADYWADHGLNALADIGNFEGITKAINGGLTNQANRIARWHRAEKALQQLAPTRVPEPTPPVPAPQPQPTEDDIQSGRATTQPENTMAPFVAAALPYVLDAAPALIDFFKGDSKVAARNSEAAKVVVAIAKEAVGARNEQDLIETMQSDPSAAPKVKAAVEANWFDIHKAAEQSVSAARDFATNYSQLTNVRLVRWNMTFIELMSTFFAVVGMLGGLYLVRWGNLGDALNGSIITLILIESVVGVRKFWLGNTQPGEARSATK